MGFAFDDLPIGTNINGYPVIAKSKNIYNKFKNIKDVKFIYQSYDIKDMKKAILEKNSLQIPDDRYYTFIHPSSMICMNYGYDKEVQELVYRWLWLITKDAVDYNGTIAEKYDVVKCTHLIDVEYGNQGTNFEYVPNGGFGWMNASYQLGFSILNKELKNSLDELIDPDTLFK